MENASKALLIAGGVLIAILILTAGVYLYSLFSQQSKEYTQTISAIQLEKFNSKFYVYVGRKNITAQEIVTVVNLAEEYGNQVQIYLGNSRLQFTTSTPEKFIKDNIDNLFSCTWSNSNPTYNSLGKIIKLKFTKN